MKSRVLPKEIASKLLSQLLSMHAQIRRLDESIWPLSCEHQLTIIEAGINSIIGRRLLYYNGYLRKNGLSRNSLSLANAMRYLAVEDYAVDPVLFHEVVYGALKPVMAAYGEFIESLTPEEADPLKAGDYLSEFIVNHLESGQSPSRFGDALARETNALLREDIVETVFPQLFVDLGWHYREFLKASEQTPSCVQFAWRDRASMFDIQFVFAELWNRYLKSIAQRISANETTDFVDCVQIHWEATLERFFRQD